MSAFLKDSIADLERVINYMSLSLIKMKLSLFPYKFINISQDSETVDIIDKSTFRLAMIY